MVQARSPDQATYEDPMSEPLATDPEGWVRQQLYLIDQLPAAERECAPSESELFRLAYLDNDIAQEDRWLERQNEDPYVRDTLAPRVFEDISEFVEAYYSFDDGQSDFLENIISFGLSHGLTENDLFAISTELAWLVGAGEFLYGMLTIVSLRVAKILYKNSYLYGVYRDISPGFDFFVDRIEHLIANGDISVRVMTVGESKDNQTAEAFYDDEYNELVFPPYAENGTIGGAMGMIIHECRHALEDDSGVSLALYQSEFDAEFNQGWTTQLLDEADGVGEWTGTERLDELEEEIAYVEEGMERKRVACLGYEDWMIKFNEALNREIADRYDDWQDTVYYELEGYDSQSAAMFYNFYVLSNFAGTLIDEESFWVRELDGLSEEELIDEFDYTAQDLIARYIMMRTINLLFPHSSYRGEVTRDYLSQFQELRVIAYMIDKEVWSELTYSLYSQMDEISEGLMYSRVDYDGV